MAYLHTTPLWTITHPHSNPSSPSVLPLSSFITHPFITTTGCKSTAVNLQAKPVSASVVAARRPGLSTRSTSTSSVPQLATGIPIPQGSKESSSPAINIPSPPLTPNSQADFDDSEGDESKDDDDTIFSSRFQQHRNQHKEDNEDPSQQMRHSSSAPSAMSPLQLHMPSALMTGFTFSSNALSPMQAKDERESYDMFVNKMEEDCWKSVSTIRTTYFFDGIGRGGGFLAIPHIASHGNAKTNMICRLLEAWLTKKLVDPTISEDSIPVLEDNIESSVQSIERHLRQDPKVWSGISKSFIHIQCGHVFMLDTCCDDETVVHLGADEFYQDYPLFVDVEIKMHCEANRPPKEHSAEVLIAFKNVVNRNRTEEETKPYVHRAMIKSGGGSNNGEVARRGQSQGPLAAGADAGAGPFA